MKHIEHNTLLALTLAILAAFAVLVMHDSCQTRKRREAGVEEFAGGGKIYQTQKPFVWLVIKDGHEWMYDASMETRDGKGVTITKQ